MLESIEMTLPLLTCRFIVGVELTMLVVMTGLRTLVGIGLPLTGKDTHPPTIVGRTIFTTGRIPVSMV